MTESVVIVRRAVTLTFAVAILSLGAPVAAEAEALFISPKDDIQCSASDRRPDPYGGLVYCQNFRNQWTATLQKDFSVDVCRGCLSNSGDAEVSVLKYGRRLVFYWGSCTMRRAGVTCIAKTAGKGFTLGPSGVKRIG